MIGGALLAMLGIRIGWIAVTGFVPASIQEYWIDDPAQKEQLRADARAQGRLEE